MTPAEYCRIQGLEGLMDLEASTGQSRQTLQNWYKNKLALFKVVVAGTVTQKEQEDEELPPASGA